MYLRIERQTILASYIERPDTLWPVNFVSRQRQHVDRECLYIQRQFAEALRRVGMAEYALLTTNAGNTTQVTDAAKFIIHLHQRDH